MSIPSQVKEVLTKSIRSELRDHAFGDKEITWNLPDGTMVAEAYVGSCSEFSYSHDKVVYSTINYAIVDEISKLGIRGSESRNDSSGPDEFVQGRVMKGLSSDDVFEELTSS